MKFRIQVRFQPIILALLPFLILVVGFEVLPLISMIWNSFQTDDGSGWTPAQYATALTSPYYLQAMRNSLQISLYSSLIGIILALFSAYAITRFSEKARERILMVSNMTSNFAGVPLAFAYIILLGNNGVFTILLKQWGLDVFVLDLYSWIGLILVYVYFQVPLATLLLYPAYHGIREQWREAASLLGAGSYKFWRYIALPVMFPSIAGTFGILFANAMGAYATAYALVGGNYNLLVIRIGSLVSGDVLTRPQLGSALAVILGLMMVAAIALNTWMARLVRRDLG